VASTVTVVDDLVGGGDGAPPASVRNTTDNPAAETAFGINVSCGIVPLSTLRCVGAIAW
jgi:hypothetical protein